MSYESRRPDGGARWDRAASASGVVFAVLAFVAFVLTGRPEEEASSSDIVQFFADNETAVEWQALLFGLAAIAFLWFAARLAELIRVVAGTSLDRVATFSVAGAAASTGLFLAGAAAFGAVAESGEESAAALFDFGDLAFGLSSFTAAAFVAGASAGIVRATLLEDWLGWVGGALAALLVLNGIVRTLVDGDAGATLGTITFVVFLLWVLAVSALVTARHSRYATLRVAEMTVTRTTAP